MHLYRWGDGGSHFHVWFLPRPLGMLEASGAMLPLWEDVLPNVPDEELAEAARRVAAAMGAPTDRPTPPRGCAHPNAGRGGATSASAGAPGLGWSSRSR